MFCFCFVFSVLMLEFAAATICCCCYNLLMLILLLLECTVVPAAANGTADSPAFFNIKFPSLKSKPVRGEISQARKGVETL